MEGKIVTSILGIAGAALLGVSIFVRGGQDTKPPVITVGSAEITYTEGSSYDELLADVTAEDNKDQDMTDKVFVDRILAAKDGQHATVVYAAIDSSKNVATAERMVNYVPKDDTAALANGEAVQDDEDKTKPEDQKKTEEEQKADEKKDEEPQDGETPDSEEEQTDREPLVPNGKSPAIRLKKNQATIQRGDSFDGLSYVESAVDDTDDRAELYKHIHIDGRYNTKTAGTYKLKYYVTDSKGNASNIEEFTLIVE